MLELNLPRERELSGGAWEGELAVVLERAAEGASRLSGAGTKLRAEGGVCCLFYAIVVRPG